MADPSSPPPVILKKWSSTRYNHSEKEVFSRGRAHERSAHERSIMTVSFQSMSHVVASADKSQKFFRCWKSIHFSGFCLIGVTDVALYVSDVRVNSHVTKAESLCRALFSRVRDYQESLEPLADFRLNLVHKFLRQFPIFRDRYRRPPSFSIIEIHYEVED